MDVLLSWSKPQSNQVASLLFEWLPTVLPGVRPWKSDESIDKGKDWFGELQRTLGPTKVGIICVTAENARSPWLFYEAGAIAAKGLVSSVCPFLLDVEPGMLSDGPLGKFQCTVAK